MPRTIKKGAVSQEGCSELRGHTALPRTVKKGAVSYDDIQYCQERSRRVQ